MKITIQILERNLIHDTFVFNLFTFYTIRSTHLTQTTLDVERSVVRYL